MHTKKIQRVTFQTKSDECVVGITAKRNVIEMVFLFLFSVLACPLLSLFLFSETISNNSDFSTIFFAVLVLASGLISLYSAVWQHSGEEIITVTSTALRIRRRIYGSGNEYLIKDIEIDSIQLSGLHILKFGSSIMFWGLPWHKAIRVKSNRKLKYFGNDLTVEEANEVIIYLVENLKRLNSKVTNNGKQTTND